MLAFICGRVKVLSPAGAPCVAFSLASGICCPFSPPSAVAIRPCQPHVGMKKPAEAGLNHRIDAVDILILEKEINVAASIHGKLKCILHCTISNPIGDKQ